MALSRNTRNVFSGPVRYFGSFRFQGGEWTSGGLRQMFAGGVSEISSYPLGTLDQSSFILPQKPGGLGATTGNQGRISALATLVPARPLNASVSLTLIAGGAQLDQIVSGVASASLTLVADNAQLASAAGLSASGSLALSTDNALCGAIFSVTASSSTQALPDVFLSALGNISAQAGGPEALSPQGLARAVWNEPTNSYVTTNTFGKKVNDLSGGTGGGGSGPTAAEIADAVWDEALSDHTVSGSFGDFVGKKVLTVAKFLGFK